MCDAIQVLGTNECSCARLFLSPFRDQDRSHRMRMTLGFQKRERERERNKLFKHGAKEGAAALKAAPGAQLDFWNFLSVYQYYKKSDVHVGLAIIQHIGNFTPREI